MSKESYQPEEEMAKIKKIKLVGFSDGGPFINEDLKVLIENQKHIHEEFFTILEKLKQKDPGISLNFDRVGNKLQMSALTKNGEIIITNSFDSIFIEQDGKETIKFDISKKEEAAKRLEEIIEAY